MPHTITDDGLTEEGCANLLAAFRRWAAPTRRRRTWNRHARTYVWDPVPNPLRRNLAQFAASELISMEQWQDLYGIARKERLPDLFAGLAANPLCPLDLLDEWSRSTNPRIRRGVASNPNCPLPILLELANRPHSHVQRTAKAHPRVAEFYGYAGERASIWATAAAGSELPAQRIAADLAQR